MIIKMPQILVLSGLDPTGGAGLSADIETMAQIGVNALPIATIITVQNTKSFINSQAVSANIIKTQVQHLAEDISFQAIKIGLLANEKQIETIIKIVKTYRHLPIILDPIIITSTNKNILTKKAINKLKILADIATIISPNMAELQQLTNTKDEQEAVNKLKTPWILLTKTDISKKVINHKLYYKNKPYKIFSYKKIIGSFHGSGCTLSSAIASYIVKGSKINKACSLGLDYTYKSLLFKYKIAKNQFHPQRINL